MRKGKIQFGKQESQDFHHVVKDRVKAWFEAEGISPYADTAMWLKIALHLLAYLIFFLLIYTDRFQGFSLALLFVMFGVVQALMGFNISHDALHGSISASPRLNRWLGYCFDFCGESSFVWKNTHNRKHHTYTNIAGYDADIDKAPILRFSPHDPWRPLNRFQHLYLLPLYALISFSWIYWGDWKAFSEEVKKGRANLKDRAIFAFFKGLNFLIMVILPFAALSVPISWLLFSFVVMNMAASLLLSVVFQMAHLVEGVEFPLPDASGMIQDEWAAHEMKTTSNFATKNRFLSWFLGGLNFQVEHHLFPGVCHTHYPKIAPIVRRTAEEFGLPYNEQPTFTRAFCSHLRLVKQFGNLGVRHD